MKFHPRHNVLWFFVWRTGTPGPYPTAICAYTRKQLIEEVRRQVGGDWKKLYRQGGRAMRCAVNPVPEERNP